ncbi:DUF4843 domain-containing protein [Carboxylicivirga marina]|uniref:DUF4843 domain-containing protein n=1 Tax=Carboxylicivirga marina TaxID=2800988 RepID=A0ABS1HN41_9BACT|nr:DUF4843 domain-containing protein [Carboxylicivirga marina]MBK3519046.1 DUF4843 domain-containing protein [Carboxylicivirga marina]
MKTFKKSIYLLLILPLFASCEVDGLFDIEQESTVIQLDQEKYAANFLVVDGEVTETQDEIEFVTFGKKLSYDVKINIAIDQTETTASPDMYELVSTTITLPANSSRVALPITYNTESLPNGESVKIVFKIESVDNNLRLHPKPSVITIQKAQFDIAQFIGKYDYMADGWSRDYGELRRTDDPFVYEMYGFWGVERWMPCNLDISNPEAIKLYFPKGDLLDPGWDDKGAWWFARDCIGVLDYENSLIDYIQFDYVTDDDTTGSFPWCEETCQMVRK